MQFNNQTINFGDGTQIRIEQKGTIVECRVWSQLGPNWVPTDHISEVSVCKVLQLSEEAEKLQKEYETLQNQIKTVDKKTAIKISKQYKVIRKKSNQLRREIIQLEEKMRKQIISSTWELRERTRIAVMN